MHLIDLHTHSTASDGSMTPAELVRHAKQRGLKAIALTDHDTVDGLEEAVAEGMAQDIEVIPGLEISVDFVPEMHILGYFTNGDYSNITKFLEELRKNRTERNPKIVRKLNELGMDISMEEVDRLAFGSVAGRPHIARLMIEKSYVGSVGEAFDKYLASGRPAYFKKDKFTPKQGILKILKAGGIPVLAHPIYLNMDVPELDELISQLSRDGLKGVEVYYTENTIEQTGTLLKLSEKYKLLVTGGSDFHGSFKPGIEIGVGRGELRIPYTLLDKMKNQFNAT